MTGKNGENPNFLKGIRQANQGKELLCAAYSVAFRLPLRACSFEARG